MSEELTEQIEAPGAVVPETLTYNGLLDQDPDMHPLLREHVERLAAQEQSQTSGAHAGLTTEDVEESLAEVALAEAALLPARGRHAAPEAKEALQPSMLSAVSAKLPSWPGVYAPDSETAGILEKGEYSTAELDEFIGAARERCEATADVEGRRGGVDEPNYGSALEPLSHVPPEKLRAMYHSKEHSGNLRYLLTNSWYAEEVAVSAKIMQGIYGQEDVLDLYEPSSASSRDPIVQKLLSQDGASVAVASVLNESSLLWPEGTNAEDESIRKRDWADRYLKLVTGLPEASRKELLFDAYSRTSNQETGLVDSQNLATMLARAANSVRTLGVEKVLDLRKQAGITAIDYYELKQLQLMSDLLDGKQEAVEHLQAGDVTVAFVDSQGDYNGAFASVPINFGSKSNRTLFFEINQPSDLYRHMLTLAKLGIKPSTLVVAAHGEPGRFSMGNDHNISFFMNDYATESDEEQRVYYAMHARGLPRLVSEMMQDSRGIDDNSEAIGRRRLVLFSCSQAAPQEVTRFRTVPESGLAGLLGKTRREAVRQTESMAETITQAAASTNLEVYAADRPIRAERTYQGVQFKGRDTENFTVDAPATQFMLDEFGNVYTRQVEHIVLRRPDNELSEGYAGAARG